MRHILILCIFCILLMGCSSSTSELPTSLDENQETKTRKVDFHQLSGILYSNMADSITQHELKDRLRNAEINEIHIEELFDRINDFSRIVKGRDLNYGFTRSKHLNIDYDVEYYQQQRNKEHKDFLGYNCRITAFFLLRDAIKIKEIPEISTPDNLIFDIPALKFYADTAYIEEKNNAFKYFFEQIPTTTTATHEENILKAKENWIQKGIKFTNPKASLISVFFHDTIDPNKSNLFIGHVGVLVSIENSQLLFIEKLAFDQPYQAIKFKDRSELNSYLMGKYDIDYSGESGRPFIFENGELMSGYALNPEITEKIKANLEFRQAAE